MFDERVYNYPNDGTDDKDLFGFGDGFVFPYGGEHWCNSEGQYLHIVADLNYLMDTYGSYTMALCSLGVYGTKYDRVGDPLPT